MTNKSLSEQLCEVCGIKPKYKCRNVPCLHFISDSGICMLKDGFTKCNPEICKDDYTPDINHRNWKEAESVYPDFENNNNFVKLLEIYFDCKNIKKIILNSILDDFMQDKTNNDLSIDYYYSDLTEKCEKFKQAIKNEDWEYKLK